MSNHFFRDLLVGFIFIIMELLFFQHLSIFGATVDPLVFYLLWLIHRYERTRLLVMAALLGLVQDAFFDLWGMMIFSKTLLVFVFYTFVKRRSENQLLLWQIFLFILGAGLFHNIIFLGLSSFFTAYAVSYAPVFTVIANATYTAVVGALIYIFRIR